MRPEKIKELQSINGLFTEYEAAKIFGIDRTTVLYHWGRLKKHPIPKSQLNPVDRKPKVQVYDLENSYAERVKKYQSKIFIRDKVGNLIKVKESAIKFK